MFVLQIKMNIDLPSHMPCEGLFWGGGNNCSLNDLHLPPLFFPTPKPPFMNSMHLLEDLPARHQQTQLSANALFVKAEPFVGNAAPLAASSSTVRIPSAVPSYIASSGSKLPPLMGLVSRNFLNFISYYSLISSWSTLVSSGSLFLWRGELNLHTHDFFLSIGNQQRNHFRSYDLNHK